MRNRAERRHHQERVKEKRRKQLEQSYSGSYLLDDPRANGRFAATPKPCSKHCCGNPRRHYHEETFQEQRDKQDLD